LISRPSLGISGAAFSDGSGLAVSVSMDFSGWHRLQEKFNKFSKRVNQLPMAVASGEGGGPSLITLLKQATPVSNKKRGGHLYSSWRLVNAGTEGNPAVIIENISPHSGVLAFLERGTKPHLIPGNPLLRFPWKGETRTLRHVHHPGTRGKWFMRAVAKEAEVRARKYIDKSLADLGVK
jgi:hypothetical protein